MFPSNFFSFNEALASPGYLLTGIMNYFLPPNFKSDEITKNRKCLSSFLELYSSSFFIGRILKLLSDFFQCGLITSQRIFDEIYLVLNNVMSEISDKKDASINESTLKLLEQKTELLLKEYITRSPRNIVIIIQSYSQGILDIKQKIVNRRRSTTINPNLIAPTSIDIENMQQKLALLAQQVYINSEKYPQSLINDECINILDPLISNVVNYPSDYKSHVLNWITSFIDANLIQTNKKFKDIVDLFYKVMMHPSFDQDIVECINKQIKQRLDFLGESIAESTINDTLLTINAYCEGVLDIKQKVAENRAIAAVSNRSSIRLK